MVFTRVLYLLQVSHWEVGVNEMGVTVHEMVPFNIPGHSDRAISELLDSRVNLVGVTFQDCCQSIVCFLDLANDDRLQLPTRVLKV